MKINRKILSLNINLIFLLFCGISFGQIEIRGKVISSYTKEPLWDSYSIKPNIDKHPPSYSDKEGNFTIEYLEPNKEYEIILTIIGYDDQKFTVKTNDGITYKNFEVTPECDWVEKAENDWNDNKPKFLLFGSIAPIMNTKSDNSFEKKYKIQYYDFGCSQPPYECMVMYNEKIAELMDSKFGRKWRKKARKDIIGL